MAISESTKRDFLRQLVVIMEQNNSLLTASGFDPTAKIAQLSDELDTAHEAEGHQREALAAAKSATHVAQDTLATAYATGSAAVELMSGLLGKKHNLVLEIRKLRKRTKAKEKPQP